MGRWSSKKQDREVWLTLDFIMLLRECYHGLARKTYYDTDWRNCVTLACYPLGDENGMWEFVELGRHKGAVVVELNFGCSASAALSGGAISLKLVV